MTQRILTDFDMSGNQILNLPKANLPHQPVTLEQVQAILCKKYAADIGDGSTNILTVGHNLDSRDILVQVRQNYEPYQFITPEAVNATDANNVTVEFLIPPEQGEYRIIVLG